MRGVAVVAAAALAAGVAGCGNESERVEIDPGVDTSSTSSTSSSPTTDPDLAAAEAKATEFMDLTAAIATDPKRSIDDLSTVARGEASSQAKQSAAQLRADGAKAEGKFAYRDISSARVPGKSRPSVDVSMCVDASGYKVTDSGRPRAEGKDTSRAEITVEQWGDGTWYVTSRTAELEDC